VLTSRALSLGRLGGQSMIREGRPITYLRNCRGQEGECLGDPAHSVAGRVLRTVMPSSNCRCTLRVGRVSRQGECHHRIELGGSARRVQSEEHADQR
jgi:hypothetical protein